MQLKLPSEEVRQAERKLIELGDAPGSGTRGLPTTGDLDVRTKPRLLG